MNIRGNYNMNSIGMKVKTYFNSNSDVQCDKSIHHGSLKKKSLVKNKENKYKIDGRTILQQTDENMTVFTLHRSKMRLIKYNLLPSLFTLSNNLSFEDKDLSYNLEVFKFASGGTVYLIIFGTALTAVSGACGFLFITSLGLAIAGAYIFVSGTQFGVRASRINKYMFQQVALEKQYFNVFKQFALKKENEKISKWVSYSSILKKIPTLKDFFPDDQYLDKVKEILDHVRCYHGQEEGKGNFLQVEVDKCIQKKYKMSSPKEKIGKKDKKDKFASLTFSLDEKTKFSIPLKPHAFFNYYDESLKQFIR